MVELMHALPGRARYRIPAIRRDRDRAERLAQSLRAAAGKVFWSSLALNQLLLALRGGGREGLAAERPRPVLWGIAGLPLLLFALSGGGLLDLLVIAGGGWLARRWAGRSCRGPDARPSRETA